MASIILILLFIICLLLILVVMIQNPKGGGLTAGFSSANQIGGVRRTTDFLEKATWTMAIALMVVSLASAAFMDQTVTYSEDNLDDTAQEILMNRQNIPDQPAGQIPTFDQDPQ